MKRRRVHFCERMILLAVTLALCSTPAAAQSISSATITGIARDDSGAVLPGVTVEAESPALIERVRSAVTDSRGSYRIADLRPGTYTVTFSLPGFATYRREGIVVTAGFTANVDGQLSVGGIEQAITVSGAAPQVDTRSVIQQRVVTREDREALPLPSNSGGYVTIIPGATQAAANQDVGGNMGENRQQFMVHGSRANDFQQLRDGQFFGTLVAAGNFMSSVNPASIEEVTILTGGGLTAESESGGAQINVIARAGGNVFSGTVQANFSHHNFQSDNLDAGLIARGARTPPSIKSNYELAAGVGGPIKQDKLWFFASARRWISQTYQSGNYFNKLQGTLFYEPDLDRPAYEDNFYNELTARATWQVAEKHKITGMFSNEYNCNCFFGIQSGTLAPEATGDDLYKPNWRTQVAWTHPATSKLLFEAGATVVEGLIVRRLTGGTYDDISVLDANRNFRYGSAGSDVTSFTQAWGPEASAFGQYNLRFVTSYLAGAHSLRGGVQFREGHNELDLFINHNMSYTFRGPVPQSVTYYAGPYQSAVKQRTLGAFLQDQWSMGDTTLNLGLRLDVLNGWIPAVTMPAGDFVPERSFPEVPDALSWKDLSPRLGVAHDLFGNGRTAVKAFIGRYVSFQPNFGGALSGQAPSAAMVTSSTRTWNDVNGDYVPQENELGPHSAANFGQLRAVTAYDPAITHGWHNREHSWQASASIQHELRPGLSIEAGYYRTWYGNFMATDNQAISPSDFDPYCITAPADSRLPNSGQEICGFYDIKPTAFGLVDNFVTKASNFGKQKEVFNGVDVTVNARIRGVTILGGIATGSTLFERCFVVDSPQELYQCRSEQPWGAGTQVKMSAIFTLPWDVRTSLTYSNIASIPLTASYVATNAAIAPSLGRNLGACRGAAACNATALVELMEPNDVFPEGRNQQVNLRLSKRFTAAGMRIEPQVDFFNLTNSNEVLVMTTRYGPAWQNATAILAPRVIKLGLQVTF